MKSTTVILAALCLASASAFAPHLFGVRPETWVFLVWTWNRKNATCWWMLTQDKRSLNSSAGAAMQVLMNWHINVGGCWSLHSTTQSDFLLTIYFYKRTFLAHRDPLFLPFSTAASPLSTHKRRLPSGQKTSAQRRADCRIFSELLLSTNCTQWSSLRNTLFRMRLLSSPSSQQNLNRLVPVCIVRNIMKTHSTWTSYSPRVRYIYDKIANCPLYDELISCF